MGSDSVNANRNSETKSLLEPKIGVTSLRTVRCGRRPNRYVQREAFSSQSRLRKANLKFNGQVDGIIASGVDVFKPKITDENLVGVGGSAGVVFEQPLAKNLFLLAFDCCNHNHIEVILVR